MTELISKQALDEISRLVDREEPALLEKLTIASRKVMKNSLEKRAGTKSLTESYSDLNQGPDLNRIRREDAWRTIVRRVEQNEETADKFARSMAKRSLAPEI